MGWDDDDNDDQKAEMKAILVLANASVRSQMVQHVLNNMTAKQRAEFVNAVLTQTKEEIPGIVRAWLDRFLQEQVRDGLGNMARGAMEEVLKGSRETVVTRVRNVMGGLMEGPLVQEIVTHFAPTALREMVHGVVRDMTRPPTKK